MRGESEAPAINPRRPVLLRSALPISRPPVPHILQMLVYLISGRGRSSRERRGLFESRPSEVKPSSSSFGSGPPFFFRLDFRRSSAASCTPTPNRKPLPPRPPHLSPPRSPHTSLKYIRATHSPTNSPSPSPPPPLLLPTFILCGKLRVPQKSRLRTTPPFWVISWVVVRIREWIGVCVGRTSVASHARRVHVRSRHGGMREAAMRGKSDGEGS